MDKKYTPILKYWFGDDLSLLKTKDYKGNQKLWFGGSPEIDKYMTDNFSNLLILAENGQLNDWKKEPQGSLALIILLDQFSRNVYRGTPKMFANDPKAVEITLELLNDQKSLDELSDNEKMFVFMPLMHSEDKALQKKSLECFKKIVDNSPGDKSWEFTYKFAKDHQEIVEKFGRFPHRNLLLGRESTKEESEFLEKNDSGFTKSIKPSSATQKK